MFDEFNEFDSNRFDLNAFDLSNLIINGLKDRFAVNNLNDLIIESFKLNEIDYDNFNFDTFNLDEFLDKNGFKAKPGENLDPSAIIYYLYDGMGKPKNTVGSENQVDKSYDLKSFFDEIEMMCKEDVSNSEESISLEEFNEIGDNNRLSLLFEIPEELKYSPDTPIEKGWGMAEGTYIEEDPSGGYPINFFENFIDNEFLTIQRHELSRIEQQILMFFVKLIDITEEDGYFLDSDIYELLHVLQLDINDESLDLDGIFFNMENSFLEILLDDNEDPHKGYGTFNVWINSYQLYDDGSFQIELQKEVYQALKRIKLDTSLLDSSYIFKLHSKYSLLLYELLTIFPEKNEYDFYMVKDFLNYYDHHFEGAYEICNFLIEPAIIDINEHTDLNVDYEIIRDGDEILAFRFISKKKTE